MSISELSATRLTPLRADGIVDIPRPVILVRFSDGYDRVVIGIDLDTGDMLWATDPLKSAILHFAPGPRWWYAMTIAKQIGKFSYQTGELISTIYLNKFSIDFSTTPYTTIASADVHGSVVGIAADASDVFLAVSSEPYAANYTIGYAIQRWDHDLTAPREGGYGTTCDNVSTGHYLYGHSGLGVSGSGYVGIAKNHSHTGVREADIFHVRPFSLVGSQGFSLEPDVAIAGAPVWTGGGAFDAVYSVGLFGSSPNKALYVGQGGVSGHLLPERSYTYPVVDNHGWFVLRPNYNTIARKEINGGGYVESVFPSSSPRALISHDDRIFLFTNDLIECTDRNFNTLWSRSITRSDVMSQFGLNVSMEYFYSAISIAGGGNGNWAKAGGWVAGLED